MQTILESQSIFVLSVFFPQKSLFVGLSAPPNFETGALGRGFQLRQLRVEGFRLVLDKLYRGGGGYTAMVICLSELPK